MKGNTTVTQLHDTEKETLDNYDKPDLMLKLDPNCVYFKTVTFSKNFVLCSDQYVI